MSDRARGDKQLSHAQTTRLRLETPRESRFRFDWDVEAVGRFSERIARFLGTGRYLAMQTVLVVVWILLNVFAVRLQWDPYPFILLNLAFSTQAAYAAPLILLAQNRQENRDRIALDEDRTRAAQTKADTEFLARELAALRIALGEVTTRDYLRRELDDLKDFLGANSADAVNSTGHSAAGSASRGKSARRPGRFTDFAERDVTGM
ncbi:DUF1003 domain-containing protein [Skermania piniformis]|uniref:DUF1003 domain-containing protein n=1 Tax=Skermania pinensis TaxID=39122 RepID=A0ABX8S785_9ACTN|nr:DUF1003 domain-containing protein [Skermania piniformis]QXQ13131.1 DUF1003 domain-containing protein [Skermania piniformis]